MILSSARTRPRAFHAIVEQVRDDIFRGRRRPGDRLPPEQVLADQFAVSRTGVREALRVLEIQGLIQVRHGYGGGVFVADVGGLPLLGALQTLLQVGQLDVREVYDARVLFEPVVTRLAVERGTSGLAHELEENVLRARAALEQETDAFGTNLQFHTLLAEGSGNRVVSVVMRALMELLERVHQRHPTNQQLSRKALESHRRIIDAVRSGDARRAEALMIDHLRAMEGEFSRIAAKVRRDRARGKTIPPWRGVRLPKHPK